MSIVKAHGRVYEVKACDIERFDAKWVEDPDTGCWIWTAAIDKAGYGAFNFGGHGKLVRAHRFSYEARVGPIPAGLVIDHLCRCTKCVNPTHLEPVTQRVNSLRGPGMASRNAARVECPHGHPYTPENLVPSELKRGVRKCIICKRARDVVRLARRKAEASVKRISL